MNGSMLIANWKMYKTQTETEAFLTALAQEKLPEGIDLIICPPYTALTTAKNGLADDWAMQKTFLGAQNCADQVEGAYTGEISAAMLKDAGCDYVIVGHSERRKNYKESDAILAKKAELALEVGLKVVFCIGETAVERTEGLVAHVLNSQLDAGLSQLNPEKTSQLIVAYEPVWAIGTGKTASLEQITEALTLIRLQLATIFPYSDFTIPVLYGGSVNATNIASFAGIAEGALVGGASLKADSFAELARLFAAARQ